MRKPSALALCIALASVAVLCGAVALEVAAQDAPKEAPKADKANDGKEAVDDEEDPADVTLWGLLRSGGPVMIPIGLCSVIALAMGVERFISLRTHNIIPNDFLEGLKRVIGVDRENVVAAIHYCEDRPCPISNIFKAGISRTSAGNEAVEKAIEDAGAREVYRMKRSLRWLSVIARLAPLLGLLGTIYGLIGAFRATAGKDVLKPEVHLAKGIYEALVTTAAGLTLAIPIVIAHQILCSRVDSLVDTMDEHAIEFLEYTAYREAADAIPVEEEVEV